MDVFSAHKHTTLNSYQADSQGMRFIITHLRNGVLGNQQRQELVTKSHVSTQNNVLLQARKQFLPFAW